MEKYSSYKDSGEKWLGEIPGHWDLIKTSYVFDKIGSGTTPASGNADYYSEDGEYFLQTGDLNDGVIKSTSKKITQKAIRDKSMKIYPKDSLVIAMYGATIGKMGILGINTTVNQACCVMSPSSKISIKYAFYMFTVAKTNLLLQSKGGGQPNISQETICNERIIVPPLPEQQAIVSYLDRVTGDIDRAIAESQRMIDLLNERKQIIIQHAVTKGLNPNAKRKNSGVEWIGDVPEGWEVEPFGRHFTFGKGLTITKENLQEEGVAVISYGQVHAKTNTGVTLTEDLIRHVSPSYIKSCPQSLLQINDFVFADTSEDISGSGNMVINDYPEQIFAGYHTVIARPLDLEYPKYYAYLFKSSGWKSQVQALVNGVKVYSIGKRNLKQSYILIPSKDEQQKIVAFLDKKVSEISQAIASTERKISLLRERKQIIINEVVTGKVKVS